MTFSRNTRNRAFALRLLVACAFSTTTAVAGGSLAQPVSAAGAVSYYVDCASGNDGAQGTAGAPWKSLTRASTAALLPGDQLLLARGCVWDGQRLNVSASGTAAAPITISGYGNGARPIVKNGLNSNVNVTGAYVVIDGLDSENDPRQLDPCGQPLGSYYGFNYSSGAHDNTLINSVSSGSTAGVHLGPNSRANRVISNVLTGNNVLEEYGTTNDLGAWGVNIVSSDNEIAYNLFSNNSAICTNGKAGASNSLEIFAGSNNNIHDNNSFNDRVFTELGSSSTVTSVNNTFTNNLFVSAIPSSRFIITRGADDAAYGPVPGTSLVNNTTYQTGASSQAVTCGLGCGPDMLSMSSNVLWAEEKSIYADGPFTLGRNLIWNAVGKPFVQIFGGTTTSSFVVANPQFADPASNNFLATAAPDLGVQRAMGPGQVPVAAPVSKLRILDTRSQNGYSGGKPAAGQTISLQVAGRGDVPTSGVAAVTMNLVLTDSSGSGFVTAWPSGQARPIASNINVEGVGSTISTLVTVPMGADGKVNLFTQSGGDLVADVAGWLPTGTFVANVPNRILDTRSGPAPGAGAVIDLQVGGVGPVPATGVSAVVLSLTATESAGPGFVTVWPTGTPRPLASALNAATAGATVSNQVTVPLGADGKVSIFTQSGAHLIADVAGYYVAGRGFNALTPTRILDTRDGVKPVGGQTVSLNVLGRAGVPASGVGFVVLNLTATEATAPGYVSAWPGGAQRPLTSVLNLSEAGQTRANAVFAPVGADGTVALYSQSGTDLVVDVTGWLST
jgi:hypothetical protein